MKTSIGFIYDTLTKRGWTLKKQHCEADELPECIKDRYHNIPAEYITFLCNIRTCVNPGETAWLLGAEDFSTQGEDCFQWNEFEMICLQAAIEENDTEWQCDIKAFGITICLSAFLLAGAMSITQSE